MKRDHHKMTGQPQPQHHPYPQMGAAGASRVHSVGGGGVGVYGEGIQSSSTTNPSTAAGKAKIWAEMDDAAGMDDELLAVLGYRVKSSEMADVAQKLEMALGSIETDNAALSQLSGTVHYNPSDISGWLETMLSELNPPSAASETELAAAASSHHQSTAFFDPSTIPSSSSVAGPSQIHHRSLVSDTSDLSNVISSPINQSVAGAASSTIFEEDASDFDLHAIVAGFHPPQNPIQPPPPPPPLLLSPSTDSSNTTTSTITTTPTSKRIKSELITASTSSHPAVSSPPSSLTTGSTTSHPRPRLISTTNTQETGVRLVHTLVACAEAIQSTNLQLADALVKQIGHLALSQSGAMRKVATYFAEALARRIYKIRPHPSLSLIDASTSDQLQSHFYETAPYLKFAHFTANQAILEAFSGARRVHLIDFSMKQGMQWPALIQALALRPGGPPVMRLTGIGPPQPDGSDALQEVGWKLAHFANTLGVRFHYRGFVCDNLADLEPGMILGGGKVEGGEEEEVVAVNSMFELHRLLARPGEIEKVLGNVRGMKPRIFTVAEQEANHNGSVFLDRFNEALHYYSTMFDSLEGCGGSGGGEDVMVEDGGGGGGVSSRDVAMSEVYLGRQICNVVACEGVERVERHETLAQWRGRLELAGFDPVSLGSNAFKQVSMLLSLFAGGDGYKVEEHNGCLTLGWHSRPLIATSAWQFGGR